MPIMRYPTENITMREIYDRYDENIVHILNGEYDYIEAYPDKNIVNNNGEIVGYFYACGDGLHRDLRQVAYGESFLYARRLPPYCLQRTRTKGCGEWFLRGL